MADNQVSNEVAGKPETSGQEDFVPKKAFAEVTADMHKYKAEVKDAKAQLTKEKEEKEALIREKLEEQKRFQELYEKEKEERVKAFDQLKLERKNFLDSHKVNYLIQELGGLAKPEYIKHANLNAIDITEDGQVDMTSLKKEADRFRQEHSVLLKNFKVPVLPNEAPKEKQTTAETPKDFKSFQKAVKDAMLSK